jgi:hypothetical protein
LVDVDHDPTPILLEAVPLVHDAWRVPVRAEPCGRLQAEGEAGMSDLSAARFVWPNRLEHALSKSHWFSEPPALPLPRARETRRDPITGEILNPEFCRHTVVEYDERGWGTCRLCWQPLPLASVGSEWKP